MRRLFVPTMGPSDWRRLLADPIKQWRSEKSAYEAAVAWEAARKSPRGLPPDIASVLDSEEEFRGASLVIGIPEHQVDLEGGGHASQTDLWALLTAPIGMVSTAIEAKAGEAFDSTVETWLSTAKKGSGKPDRLKQLCSMWRVEQSAIEHCRYQLMHRPAAAVLEAKRFKASVALFLVHAFGDNSASFDDYSTWRRALGISTADHRLQYAGEYEGVRLWMAWVASEPADQATLRAAI